MTIFSRGALAGMVLAGTSGCVLDSKYTRDQTETNRRLDALEAGRTAQAEQLAGLATTMEQYMIATNGVVGSHAGAITGLQGQVGNLQGDVGVLTANQEADRLAAAMKAEEDKRRMDGFGKRLSGVEGGQRLTGPLSGKTHDQAMDECTREAVAKFVARKDAQALKDKKPTLSAGDMSKLVNAPGRMEGFKAACRRQLKGLGFVAAPAPVPGGGTK